MKLRTSRILRELRAGKRPTCFKFNLGDPRIVELCGLAGASSVWICNEHVGNDWFNMENQIRAAKLYDMDTIVRVEKGSYSDYIKPFEADATAIMVPHVTTAEEAMHIVKISRFQPLGRRAMDSGNVDGAYCQVPMAEYLAHSNRQRLLIFQIESPEALENVEKIAAVPGFDILLFGPGDFSHLIGKAGQIGAPEVVAARKRVAAAAKAHGKHLMSPGTARSIGERGFSHLHPGCRRAGAGRLLQDPNGSVHRRIGGQRQKGTGLSLTFCADRMSPPGKLPPRMT
jgi:4-hydroxy-2-oxoheptanedioate aldolase